MSYYQKIECNVNECTHNSIEDSTCKLDRIQVCPCLVKGDKTSEDETACAMYSYSGDLNSEGARASRQV